MANNRLYIYNQETKKAIMLAKSFGDGWEIRADLEPLEEFMRFGDFESAILGGLSNLRLITEGELPIDADIVRHKASVPYFQVSDHGK